MGGSRQLTLAGAVPEGGVPDSHLEASGVQAVFPQASGNGVRQHGHTVLDFHTGGEVFREGGAVAHGFDRLRVIAGTDGFPVQAVGVLIQLCAQLAHQGLRHLRPAGGQLPDGVYAVLMQQLPGGTAHIQQIAHRQGPDDALPVFPGDHRGGVRLLVVAAQLGKDLVEADAHGEGQPQFFLNAPPKRVRQCPGVAAEQMEGVGDIQPALVDAEGLHQVGVFVIDGVDFFGIYPVQIVMGRQQHQVRAFFLSLPDGFGRLNAKPFGGLVLG